MDFVDLGRQYNYIKKEIDKRIDNVINSRRFIMGPEIQELENKLSEFTGRKYVLTCASGTDALVIPLMAYELEKSDAVFVSSFTFYASAESINLAGGTPVFIDSDDTYNLSPAKLRKAIEKTISEGKLKPKGIVAVDIFGLTADFDEIKKIADEYNLFIIEDGAQSFGGSYKGKMNCSFGDVSATSFFPAKPLGCYGDGGAIFTDNEYLYKRMHSIRVHGQGSCRYDNVRMGINGRMDTIQAAVLLAKLTVFKDEIDKRQIVAQKYYQNLKNSFVVPKMSENRISAWAQFTLMAENEEERETIIEKMKEHNIPIMVYYPVPMHMQTAYKYLGYKPEDLPICADMSKRVFSVPMHPYLSDDEIDTICKELRLIVNR